MRRWERLPRRAAGADGLWGKGTARPGPGSAPPGEGRWSRRLDHSGLFKAAARCRSPVSAARPCGGVGCTGLEESAKTRPHRSEQAQKPLSSRALPCFSLLSAADRNIPLRVFLLPTGPKPSVSWPQCHGLEFITR